MNPLQLFNNWYQQEIAQATVRIPSACCLSTIGLDGYPNARFVSLKEVIDDAFIVTGPLNSRKGLEIRQVSKVALTFWWPATEWQVRIQGEAARISDQQADKYFFEREVDSQIVSLVSEQGKAIERVEILEEKFREAEAKYTGKIARPGDWGGYSIKPVRIEFMEFKPSRFHDRYLYELLNGQWEVSRLQP